jgi:DNA invertase Pin-like site-specific DNA recombinase
MIVPVPAGNFFDVKSNLHNTMCYVRAYLRASTSEQDASRARCQAFAAERNLEVVSWYVENESGASLQRPELFRLLADTKCGDILLVEQVDRLTRLTTDDWEALKAKLAEKRIRVVAIDLPTSWIMADKARDDFTGRLFDAINGMLLDMLAAIARKDYDDRRRRQAQGIAKAKTAGLYRGRVEDTERDAGIVAMLEAGSSWNTIQAATGCSRSTIARLAKRGAA